MCHERMRFAMAKRATLFCQNGNGLSQNRPHWFRLHAGWPGSKPAEHQTGKDGHQTAEVVPGQLLARQPTRTPLSAPFRTSHGPPLATETTWTGNITTSSPEQAVTTINGNGAMVRVQSHTRVENQAKQRAASSDQKLPRLKRGPVNVWMHYEDFTAVAEIFFQRKKM
jgi:hypothetical protein